MKNSKNWILYLLNCLILGAILYYLFFLWKTYPFSIGGTLIFISLIAFSNYLSFFYKDLASELTLFSLIVASLMGLNFLAYIEYIGEFSDVVLIGTSVSMLIIVIAFTQIIYRPTRLQETQNLSQGSIELRRRFLGLIYQLLFSFAFIIATAVIFMLIRDEGRTIVIKHILSYSMLSLLWVDIGILYVFPLMRKYKYLSDCIPYLVVKKSTVNIDVLRKKFPIVAIGIFILGLAFELQRGFWFLWFLSWITVVLVIIVGWKIWKYVFQEGTYNIDDIKLDKINTIPYLYDLKYAFKLFGILTLIGTLYFMMLFAIALYFSK